MFFQSRSNLSGLARDPHLMIFLLIGPVKNTSDDALSEPKDLIFGKYNFKLLFLFPGVSEGIVKRSPLMPRPCGTCSIFINHIADSEIIN